MAFSSPGSTGMRMNSTSPRSAVICSYDRFLHSSTQPLTIRAMNCSLDRSFLMQLSNSISSGSSATMVFAANVNSSILFSFPLCFVYKLQKARRKDTSRRLCGIVPVNKKLCYCLLSSFLIWKVCKKIFSPQCIAHIIL